ncbi:MAG: hypothetical protein WCC64_05125 [Aliidongia sp.]
MRDIANVRSDLDELYRYIRNLIDGSRELQLNSGRGRGYIDQVISPQAGEIRRNWVRAIIRFSVVMATGEMIYVISIGVLLIVLPQLVSLPSGVLATSAITLLFMGTPINDALMALPAVGRATVALNRINQLEHSLPHQNRVRAASYRAMVIYGWNCPRSDIAMPRTRIANSLWDRSIYRFAAVKFSSSSVAMAAAKVRLQC